MTAAEWLQVAFCQWEQDGSSQSPVTFPTLESFQIALETWLQHPEHIARSLARVDILSDERHVPFARLPTRLQASIRHFLGDSFKNNTPLVCRYMYRNLVPRIHRESNTQPQHIVLFTTETDAGTTDLFAFHTPFAAADKEDGARLAFFHPRVSDFVFRLRWTGVHSSPCAATWTAHVLPMFAPTDTEECARTSNMLQPLLNRLLKFARGNARAPCGAYQKRVFHDQLVPQATFQDRYYALKKKYRHWVDKWCAPPTTTATTNKEGTTTPEPCCHAGMSTDPQKHVFEDILLATFLICLWEAQYAGGAEPSSRLRFVDMGCGNGLLVHILHSEGYRGYGVDIAARGIWDMFREEQPGTDLRVQTLHAPSLVFDLRDGEPLQEARNVTNDDITTTTTTRDFWLIGNHSDELTPWIPIITAKTNLHAHRQQQQSRCHFFLLPCCFHDLAGDRNPFGRTIPRTKASTDGGSSGIDTMEGNYGSYLRWIRYLCEDVCQLHVEWEWLRIPSTKNVALISRQWKKHHVASTVLANGAVVEEEDVVEQGENWYALVEEGIQEETCDVDFRPRLSDREKNRLRDEKKRLHQQEQQRLRAGELVEDEDVETSGQILLEEFQGLDVFE